MKATTNNPAMQQFIIERVLINPINDILLKFKNKEFRDCDINWLNDRLYKFTSFAAETLGKKFPEIELVSNDGILSDYKIIKFKEAFTTLLNYFKSF